MTKEISRWADEAMFESEAMSEGHNPKTDPPRVFLLQGTPDPLGSIAAFSAMYSGKVVRDKRAVTDDERRHHLEEMKKTKLKAPLESVNLHFMVDGIHRGITHQMVRQRTAVYAQESLRFAVVDGVADRVALPPSLAGTREPTDDEMHQFMIDPGGLSLHVKDQKQRWRTAWDYMMENVEEGYEYLVNDGMPQEDARGALPTNITTRLNYHTNLRSIQEHAGMRLCTQAQFEWRAIWGGFVNEMRNYCTEPHHQNVSVEARQNSHEIGKFCDNWQWREISQLFKPVCYMTGKCEFGAEVDRKCKIRERVQANHEAGRGSENWHNPFDVTDGGGPDDHDNLRGVERNRIEKPVFIGAINPSEWLLDPGAAR